MSKVGFLIFYIITGRKNRSMGNDAFHSEEHFSLGSNGQGKEQEQEQQTTSQFASPMSTEQGPATNKSPPLPSAGKRMVMWWRQEEDDGEEDDGDQQPVTGGEEQADLPFQIESVHNNEGSGVGQNEPRLDPVDTFQGEEESTMEDEDEQAEQEQHHDFSDLRDANDVGQDGTDAETVDGKPVVTVDVTDVPLPYPPVTEIPESPPALSIMSTPPTDNISVLRFIGTVQLIITIAGYALILRMARRHRGRRQEPEQQQQQQQRQGVKSDKKQKKLPKLGIQQQLREYEPGNGPILLDPQGVDNMLLAGGFQQVASDKNNSTITTVGDSSTLCISLEQEEEENTPHLTRKLNVALAAMTGPSKVVKCNKSSLIVKCHSVRSLAPDNTTTTSNDDSVAPAQRVIYDHNGCLGPFDSVDDIDYEDQSLLWETDATDAAATIPDSFLAAKCKRAPLTVKCDSERSRASNKTSTSNAVVESHNECLRPRLDAKNDVSDNEVKQPQAVVSDETIMTDPKSSLIVKCDSVYSLASYSTTNKAADTTSTTITPENLDTANECLGPCHNPDDEKSEDECDDHGMFEV